VSETNDKNSVTPSELSTSSNALPKCPLKAKTLQKLKVGFVYIKFLLLLSKKLSIPQTPIAKNVILEYLQRQNRPYNAKMIFENLHGKDIGLKQAVCQRALDMLVSDGEVTEKTFKKQKLYWVNQSKKPDPDAESLRTMDEQIDKLKEEYQKLQNACKALEQQRNLLDSQLTNEQLEQEIKMYTEENVRLSEKLEKLRTGQKKITPEEKIEFEKLYKTSKENWRKRKAMFREISDTFEEMMEPKAFKKLKKDLGAETDEDANVNFNDDRTSKILSQHKANVSKPNAAPTTPKKPTAASQSSKATNITVTSEDTNDSSPKEKATKDKSNTKQNATKKKSRKSKEDEGDEDYESGLSHDDGERDSHKDTEELKVSDNDGNGVDVNE
jgi:26S proteasome regulatory subunit (ATPase 3-interacting protein)